MFPEFQQLPSLVSAKAAAPAGGLAATLSSGEVFVYNASTIARLEQVPFDCDGNNKCGSGGAPYRITPAA